MSASRTALLVLRDALAAAAAPRPVVVGGPAGRRGTVPGDDPRAAGDAGATGDGVASGGADGPSPVHLQPLALTRLGRSARAGPVLDLELAVRVLVPGADALEVTEALLTALERDARYTVGPLDGPQGGPVEEVPLGFEVRVRVPVRMVEPAGPPVQRPLEVEVQPVRTVVGTVVDAQGAGVAGAVVRMRSGGPAVAADRDGRFRALGPDAAEQQLVVQVQGTTKVVTAATGPAPVIIRWDEGE